MPTAIAAPKTPIAISRAEARRKRRFRSGPSEAYQPGWGFLADLDLFLLRLAIG